jgi:predicted esterase
MHAPSLTRRAPDDPQAVVLMLHGGKARGVDPVDERSASWRRSRWMMTHIAGRANRAGTAVWLLRYGVRGWNAGSGADPSPVPDARWALDEVRREHGDVPVVLLGHSMGARTSVAVADDESVVGVVGLAPWLPADEPTRPLAGKHLAVAHGASDKITSARATRAFVSRAERVAASTEFHDMGRVGHYMLRRVADWNDFAVTRSLSLLGAEVGSDR